MAEQSPNTPPSDPSSVPAPGASPADVSAPPASALGEDSMSSNASPEYNEGMIRVLEGIEHVRTRPGMYIGDTTSRGLHHLIWEIVDNSIDEAMAGYCKSILVKINADGSCSVVDDGRGIPVGIHPTEKIPTVEVVFAKLGAGGKFEHGGSAAYKVTGGLHGVGASVVNALAEWLEVEVCREGNVHHMEFERGKKHSDLRIIGKANQNGTKVTFKPDNQIFPDIEFKYEVIQKRARELAYLNEGLHLVIEDERSGKRDEFRFDQGLVQYVKFLNEGKATLQAEPIYFKKEDPVTGLITEVAMQHNDGYNETIESFANNINTHEGGTHLSGFKTALTGTINRYAEANGLLKDQRPTGDDVREGLIAIISVKVREPQFEGQTKTKLGNSEVEGFVASAVNERLGAFFEENPKAARTIFEKSMQAYEAREAARKARELTRRKNVLEGNSLPGKLSDCRSRSNEDTELFLVEGDSAGGSAKQGRDSNVQAILALRGKLLNVEKATLIKMLGHEEIRTIISALGCGIRDDFNIDKRRYGKIVIMTDADVDGSHIRTLLLTFFFRHMQELIRAGRIFVAQPPLYQITRRKKIDYVLNDRVMKQTLTDLGLDGTQLSIRDTDSADEVRRLAGDELRRVVELLTKLEEIVKVIERRGINFATFLERRDAHGHLPQYRVVVSGEEKFFHSVDERDEYLKRAQSIIQSDFAPPASAPTPATSLDAPASDASPSPAELALKRLFKNTELHEVKELERLFVSLEQHGLLIEDYYLTQEESVAGEKLPTKFLLISDNTTIEVAGVGRILPEIHRLGRSGIEIKRFKGLGEMNAEELWETTLDPSARVLFRVTLEEAGEAERLFSVLMGEDVERRRQFIEEHALEVKNLDV